MHLKNLVRQIFLFLIILCCLTSSQVWAEKVYLMSTGNTAGDDTLMDILTIYGHTVTLGVEKQNFDGTQSLAGIGVVLLTNSYNWGYYGMPDAGQTALLNFVVNGGGLITSEWTMWDSSDFAILEPSFPTEYQTYNHATSTTYTRNVPDSIMDFNLPVSFTFYMTNISGTETSLTAKVGATVFYDTSNFGGGYVGVAGWGYGSGRVMNFSTVMGTVELGDNNYQQLLSNAVNWAGQNAVVPLPGAWMLLGSGLLVLGLLTRR